MASKGAESVLSLKTLFLLLVVWNSISTSQEIQGRQGTTPELEDLDTSFSGVLGDVVTLHDQIGKQSHSLSADAMNESLTFITHRQLDDGYQICRFERACRIGDGTLILPKWMEVYSNKINHCGLKGVVYSTHESIGKPSRLSDSDISLTYEYQDFDVFGNDAPRGEQGLLVDDVTPSLLMMDIFRRPAAYKDTIGKTYLVKGGNPKSNETIWSNVSHLKSILLIDSRVSHTKDFMWPKSLLRLVRNTMEGELMLTDLKDIYGWKVRSRAHCFRSIFSTNIQTKDIPEGAITTDNSFFSTNGLTRSSAERSLRQTAMCNVKVLILNRYGKRFIEGADAMVAAISAYGRLLSKIRHGVTIESEVVFFERSSFHEQVSVMQESDIVVATYGNTNANFMFLRPQSRVFEVLPFGFSSTLYRNLSQVYGVVYESVRSQPDTEVFSACVKHFNGDRGKTREAFMEQWRSVAKKFTEDTIRQGANIDSNFSVPENRYSDLKMLHECASYQRISVDIRNLAGKVALAAASQCHVNANMSSLDM